MLSFLVGAITGAGLTMLLVGLAQAAVPDQHERSGPVWDEAAPAPTVRNTTAPHSQTA